MYLSPMDGSWSNGKLLRSSSLTQLQEDEANRDRHLSPGSNGYDNTANIGGVANGTPPTHPGHRYYTPQPSKRKALKPVLSSTKPQTALKPKTPPVFENGHASIYDDADNGVKGSENNKARHNLKLVIPKPSANFEGSGPDSGIRSASFDSDGSLSAGANSVRRALKPPSAQSKSNSLNRNQQNSVSSTPSTPGSSDGLRVSPEYAEAGQIQPKRKAPTKPPIGRRRSDPLSNSRHKRSGGATCVGVDDDEVGAGNRPRLPRVRTLEGGISPSELENYAGGPGRHRYFTPQPKRRKPSFGRKSPGNNSPAFSPPQPPQYTRSPVARLANQIKQQVDRQHSSDATSPGSATIVVTPPVRTPRTPTKPPPNPPTQKQQTPAVEEPFHFVSEEEVAEAHQKVGGRRPRSLSHGAGKRPLPSVPGRARSGSASKVPHGDIHNLTSRAIQRKRHNRKSAPAGCVASILSDSNSSLHAASSQASASPGAAKKRDTLREELLRQTLVRKESILSPVAMLGDGSGAADKGRTANGLEQVDGSLKTDIVREKLGYDEPDFPPRYSPVSDKKISSEHGDFPPQTSPSASSVFGGSSSAGSPGQPPRRRNKSSLSSLMSMPKNLVASNEFLSQVLLSERGSHRKLKAVVGFLVGVILGGLLFLGLFYGLGYGLYPALIITSISTAFMALCLAFTVRARCVGMLMVPTICTSRGRAAFLTFIVTLLLRGPIHNIYLNSNEVSDSMSCSAQLAYNQTREVQEAAQRVLDAYVQGLLGSVDRIQQVVEQVQLVFEPVEQGLNSLNDGLDQAGRELSRAADACDDILNSAHRSCTRDLNTVYYDCQEFFQNNVPEAIQGAGSVCEAFKAGTICSPLKVVGICQAPTFVDSLINNALTDTRTAMQSVVDTFSADVDLERYFENRVNSSTTADDIQQAIAAELDKAYSYVDIILAVSDKLLALSFVWVCIKSYLYHSSYRTKDSFDNKYITAEFKRIDTKRKDREQSNILPLKKSERNDLVDVTSLHLSKRERGYFKFGLSTVILHSIIAGLLMFIDFGLYWLLSKIQEHGDVQIQSSGEASTDVEIGGVGIVADLVRILFSEGFQASTAFNTSLDTTICLPQPVKPNDNLAIVISILYLLTIIMVLSQAYAQRLLRYIAAYYYPEREMQRIHYLYGRTLQKRQTLMRMLKDSVRSNKREQDATNKISIISQLAIKYPCCKRLFTACGWERRACFGCSSPDDGLMVYCSDQSCNGAYCEECASALGSVCTICKNEIFRGKVPLQDEHKL